MKSTRRVCVVLAGIGLIIPFSCGGGALAEDQWKPPASVGTVENAEESPERVILYSNSRFSKGWDGWKAKEPGQNRGEPAWTSSHMGSGGVEGGNDGFLRLDGKVREPSSRSRVRVSGGVVRAPRSARTMRFEIFWRSDYAGRLGGDVQWNARLVDGKTEKPVLGLVPNAEIGTRGAWRRVSTKLDATKLDPQRKYRILVELSTMKTERPGTVTADFDSVSVSLGGDARRPEPGDLPPCFVGDETDPGSEELPPCHPAEPEEPYVPPAPSGESVYVPDAPGRHFNSGSAGWTGSQEFSLLCFLRGVTCPKWDTYHVPNGGPKGAGDGFLRMHATSLVVAPCTPQTGVARWDSPLFSYNGAGGAQARNWRMKFDVRLTYLLAGHGHGSYAVEILDSKDRVVTTAYSPEATLIPNDKWRNQDWAFDGRMLKHGERYRISLRATVLHAESAASLGNVDFDNVAMVASTKNGPPPMVVHCVVKDGDAKVRLTPGPFCAVGLTVGEASKPLLGLVERVLKNTVTNESGEGLFLVGDRTTGQILGWLVGRESVPSLDPTTLPEYLEEGKIGLLGDYAVAFIGKNVEEITKQVDKPGGIVRGLILSVKELKVEDLTDIDLDWSLKNLDWNLKTLLDSKGGVDGSDGKAARRGGPEHR